METFFPSIKPNHFGLLFLSQHRISPSGNAATAKNALALRRFLFPEDAVQSPVEESKISQDLVKNPPNSMILFGGETR